MNYHYLLSWDYKSGEYGNYDSGINSVIIDLLTSLGAISLLITPSSEAIRDALYRTATMKNVTVEDALEEVKQLAEKDAVKVKLTYRH